MVITVFGGAKTSKQGSVVILSLSFIVEIMTSFVF